MFVTGEDVPGKTAHALNQASLRAQLGDPGRFLAEYAKEAKLQTRGWLISWTQVEYHQLYSSERAGSLVSLHTPRLGRMGSTVTNVRTITGESDVCR
jgi:hypothetical protein